MIPVRSITISKRTKIFPSSVWRISWRATAAPVLVFEIIYREMKEKPITKVFVAPRRTRNPWLFVLAIIFPIIAACPLPIPGRKLHKGDAMIAPVRGLRSFVSGLIIFCSGIFVF